MKILSTLGRYQVSEVSATLTSAIGVVIITPLCGLLFQCHCDWPWLQFYFDCNFFDAEIRDRCPWCASGWPGLAAIAAAFVLAAVAAAFPTHNQNQRAQSVAVRLTKAMAVFMLAAVVAAALTAYIRHYPWGIGGLLLAHSESHRQ